MGRQVLNNVSATTKGNSDVPLWYRAVSAHLLAEGDLAEAAQHLGRARQMFPNQAAFLLDSAYFHLELSSSAVQASVEEIRAGGGDAAVDSRTSELQRAERFLRDALTADPRNVSARLRLGHTLGELGRHSDAAAELRRAIELEPDTESLYLAELFLGRAEHALGKLDEAKRRFERAVTLFPDAQSPQLALAYLAREAGDRGAAYRALRAITDPPDGSRLDPWLWYYKPHREDAAPLMELMRSQLSGAPR
jgi:tetratricopeptide (TPR) repeat protein